MKLEIFTDGACSGNPGPAGIGVVILHEGKVVKEIAQFIGEATNNIAEYSAVIAALKEAVVLGAIDVSLKSDSQLLCEQVNGRYAVKQPHIKKLVDEVLDLIKGFHSVEVRYIPREQNSAADQLSRQGIKAGQDGRPVVTNHGEESPSSKG